MTATITELDPTLLEDLAPPCDLGLVDHPEPPPAEWILHWSCPCPPTHSLACTDCKDAFLALHPQHLFHCQTCAAYYRPPQTAARLIEPLNRRSS